MKTLYKILSNGFYLSFIFLFLSCNGDNNSPKSDEEIATEVAEAIAANPICDRTEVIKNAIVKAAQKPSCEELSTEDLAKVTILTFHNDDIQEVKSGDFIGLIGLIGLKELLLSSTNLQTLPADLLVHLSNLENFYADRNSLQAVPEGFFDGLTSLKKINLYNNQLSSLPVGLFEDLTALEKVYLGGNNFSEEEKNRLREELGDKLTSI